MTRLISTSAIAFAVTAMPALADTHKAPASVPGLEFLNAGLNTGDERALLALAALPVAIVALLVGTALLGDRY